VDSLRVLTCRSLHKLIYFSGFVLLLTAVITICIGWAASLTKAHGQIQQLGNERAVA
jgi:hypothetical protein